MRRAVARGRVFPQYFSTDRRYGRLSLKAIGLFPLMWTNADDQGRLVGDPEEIKYSVCPNIDHIIKTDIPELLQELQDNELILCYDTPKSPVIQMLDWWEVHHKMQWIWPSDYDPPEGWQDHLRYKKDAYTEIRVNWPFSGEDSGGRSGEKLKVAQVSQEIGSGENPGERSGEPSDTSPLTTPNIKKKKKKKKKEGEGNSPESSGEKPSPSPTTDLQIINNILIKSFRHEWGRVPAEAPDKVVERNPTARELAQLRDLGEELSARGGVPLDYIKDAFREAAGAKKFRVSYVRAVLFDWLGLPRSPP